MAYVNFMAVSFDTDGSVEAMCREAMFDLSFLGRQKIERASEILFNEDTQKWYFTYGPGLSRRTSQEFDTYERAREVEVAWFEYCRLDGIEPTDDMAQPLLSLAITAH